MAVVPTAMTITPAFDGTKRMTCVGEVAVNERVHVTVVGVNDMTDPDAPVIPDGLVLSLTSPCGRREYARFPANVGELWTASGADATCILDLGTETLRAVFANACANDTREGELRLENGSTDNLYGRSALTIYNWIQNPLDPVAGSTQIQTQINNLTTRIEEHQHNEDTDGESSFPHNNLSGRDEADCHPAINSAVSNAASVASSARATAEVASSNATSALSLAEEVETRLAVVEDWMAGFASLGMFDPETAYDIELREQVQAITNKLRGI